MHSPPPRSHIPLYPEPVAHYRGPSPRFLFRARFSAADGRPCDWFGALALETTLSILPPRMLQGQNLTVLPLHGWGGRAVPEWCGIPCEIRYIQFEVRPVGSPAPLVLGVSVRIPTVDAPWMGDYLLLGSDFLRRRQAEVRLQCQAPLRYNPRFTHPCGELIL